MRDYSKLSISERECHSWSEFEGETIFLTGGSGFFGTALLYSLLNAKKKVDLNINVTVLSRNINLFKQKHPKLADSNFIKLLEGDVLSFIFPDEQFSKIIHLATTSACETFNGEDQLTKYKTLVNGTERVLQFAVKCNAEKIIFTSSGVVYGQLPHGMTTVNELYSGAPATNEVTSALAQGKRSAEFLISYYAEKYNFDYVIARCFSFVGPYLPLEIHYAIGNFVFDALHKDFIEIKSDGMAMRSYLDVNDLTVWILRLLAKECNHKIYNVGSNVPVSILDLAKKVSEIVAPEKEVIICGNREHSVGNFARNWYVPEIDRARNELAVDVWINLDQAIARIFNPSN